jgi:glycosyltransferase involved in cell wall biosynthesis
LPFAIDWGFVIRRGSLRVAEKQLKIDLAFITHNRLAYTELSLASILADPTEEFSLTIWDNSSTDGTVEYLKNEVNDPRIRDIVFSKTNVGQTAAINEIWSGSTAGLLGKIDNDCLMTPGWTRILAQAHADIPKLGTVACWHFPLDDFDEKAARKAGKIQTFGRHQILRHPWTCGTGLLIKRDTFQQYGPFQDQTTTQYWLNLALNGYINGFYYPLVLQEHMDDLRSKHCLINDEQSLQEYREVTVELKDNCITSLRGRRNRRRTILRDLNRGPWRAEPYAGWRGRLRGRVDRIRQKVGI